VTQPIFTAGRITSQVHLAEAQQQSALIQYEKAIQTAFREVADALVQYRRVKEIRTQQALLVTTLQDRSRLAYMRYRGGVDTLLNALDAAVKFDPADADLRLELGQMYLDRALSKEERPDYLVFRAMLHQSLKNSDAAIADRWFLPTQRRSGTKTTSLTPRLASWLTTCNPVGG